MLLDGILADLASAGARSMETRFVSAPKDAPFAIWDATCAATGGDDRQAKRTWSAVVTVVEHPGEALDARAALEGILDAAHLDWTRGMRQWSEDERVYMTDYEFSWAEKAPRQ